MQLEQRPSFMSIYSVRNYDLITVADSDSPFSIRVSGHFPPCYWDVTPAKCWWCLCNPSDAPVGRLHFQHFWRSCMLCLVGQCYYTFEPQSKEDQIPAVRCFRLNFCSTCSYVFFSPTELVSSNLLEVGIASVDLSESSLIWFWPRVLRPKQLRIPDVVPRETDPREFRQAPASGSVEQGES